MIERAWQWGEAFFGLLFRSLKEGQLREIGDGYNIYTLHTLKSRILLQLNPMCEFCC